MENISVVIIGATGAVGGEALKTLLKIPQVKRITILGRRPVAGISAEHVYQYNIDIFNPDSYKKYLSDHQVAICTLGVGQPSKISREEFIKIDKLAVLNFGKACKDLGIAHFQLLSSVGISAQSSSFFLRAKGELVEELKSLNFNRLSIFQPSMILTPTNRYGLAQAITLFVWPIISPLLIGGLKKYRGIRVEKIGSAMARNVLTEKVGLEMLTWKELQGLTK